MSLSIQGSPSLVLGMDDPADYFDNPSFFGCVVGRYANRIAGGSFELDGRAYLLQKNEGDVTLHGGPGGFGRRAWDVEGVGTDWISFRLHSRNGDQGFPGNLEITATYRLSDQDELSLICTAHTDAPTYVSLTNHSYFNLSGDATSPITDHILTVAADLYTPVDEDLIPLGSLKTLSGTPLDLRNPRLLGAVLDGLEEGIDHNFVILGEPGKMRPAAVLWHPASGRRVEVESNQRGLQVYTGGVLGKQGPRYSKHAGLCLEPQEFPDAPNQALFPIEPLQPGEVYRHETVYRFSQNEKASSGP